MKLETWVTEVKNQELAGKKASQISLETYITEKLGMKILEVKELESDYEDSFEILATNGVNEYLFVFKYYQSKSMNIHQNVLILKEVRGNEGVFKTEQTLWLFHENTPQNKYLLAPLSELIEDSLSNAELKFTVNYLKDACSSLDGYAYTETKENDIESFVLSINDLCITKGFSNTIQVSFKSRYDDFNIIFKERKREELINELNDVIAFLRAYVNEDVRIGTHSLTTLCSYLKEHKHYANVMTRYILGSNKESKSFNLSSNKESKSPIIRPFVIGHYDSYHQVEVSLYFDFKLDSFEVNLNYMFKPFSERCETIQEVKDCLQRLEMMFNRGEE